MSEDRLCSDFRPVNIKVGVGLIITKQYELALTNQRISTLLGHSSFEWLTIHLFCWFIPLTVYPIVFSRPEGTLLNKLLPQMLAKRSYWPVTLVYGNKRRSERVMHACY